jgi:RNA polymerase sigma-70 factor (ECF subfamily)
MTVAVLERPANAVARDAEKAAESWELAQRAQAGDADAFAEIYDRYVDMVHKFVYRRCGDQQVAEDLTSETFLRALKRIGSFTWQGRDLGAWLVTIARNLVADHFKSGRYRLEQLSPNPGVVPDRQPLALGDRWASVPETTALDYLGNVDLLATLEHLTDEQREVLVLRFQRGLTIVETAREMHRNIGAVKALQYRAVRAMANALPEGFVRW